MMSAGCWTEVVAGVLMGSIEEVAVGLSEFSSGMEVVGERMGVSIIERDWMRLKGRVKIKGCINIKVSLL